MQSFRPGFTPLGFVLALAANAIYADSPKLQLALPPQASSNPDRSTGIPGQPVADGISHNLSPSAAIPLPTAATRRCDLLAAQRINLNAQNYNGQYANRATYQQSMDLDFAIATSGCPYEPSFAPASVTPWQR